MTSLEDYLNEEYGERSIKDDRIRFSDNRNHANAFGSVFPLISTYLKDESILSISSDYKEDNIINYSNAWTTVESKYKYAKRLKVNRYIIKSMNISDYRQAEYLNFEELASVYPKLDTNILKDLCSNKRVLGFKENENVVCAGIYTRVSKTFDEISVYVKKEYRKKGYGMSIAQSMLASTVNKRKLFIYVCELENYGSRKIIETIGNGSKVEEEIVFAR